MKWIAFWMASAVTASADTSLIEDFSDGAAPGWQYVSDRVMGGVSNGVARFTRDEGISFARLEGTVSTANNGGFIQIRRTLDTPLTAESTGVALRVRGNGARYYVHVRPVEARRPWQYFQAAFDTTDAWQDIELAWSDFTPQGGLTSPLQPDRISSIGIVAYGDNYEAALDIEKIWQRQ